MSHCRQKRRFRTALDATPALARVLPWDDDNRLEMVPHRVYRCERGLGWHLTAAPFHGPAGGGRR